MRDWMLLLNATRALSDDHAAAQAEIRRIGAAALPTLVYYLRHQDLPVPKNAHSLLQKANLVSAEEPTASEWRQIAALSCGALGRVALPALSALQEAARDQAAAPIVVRALTNMYPESASVLTNLVLSARDPNTRSLAAECLLMGLERYDSAPALCAALGRALQDQDKQVRLAAAATLGFAVNCRELVIPALSRALGDPEASVREQAASSLERLRARTDGTR